MKQKLYVVVAVILLVAIGVLVFVLSKGPVQAVDPRKDFSKAAKPTSQVLSDAYDLSQAPNSESSMTTTTPGQSNTTTTTSAANTSVTTPTTHPVAQNTTLTPTNSGNESKDAADKQLQPVKASKQGVVDAVLQTLNNLRL